ncbi:hypothetical protein [Actinoplanes sp. NPDC051851]|uniref:hypothetical protein n=1 Tax=Actinoplanes sp. NPDC051851 TaxID=3154753 RepID=UPI00342B840E
MGLQVELYVGGRRVHGLPDPSGGLFDAAGDFDRLLSRADPVPGLLGAVDPHGETRFGASRMRALVAEVEVLLTRAADGSERRGVMRLRAMAEYCAEQEGELVFAGD